MIQHETSDADFREGEPPFLARPSRNRNSLAFNSTGLSIGLWIGPTSVFCAAVAWISWCLTLWAYDNPVPKVIIDNYDRVGHALIVSLLTALIGGACSGLFWRSKAGYVAFSLAAILWISVLTRSYLLNDGWLK
jgi:hypothetical protein